MSGRTATWTDLTSARHATSCTGTGFDRLDFTYDGEGHRTRIVETPMAGSPIVTRDLRYQGDAVVEEKVTDALNHPNGDIIRSTIVDDAGAPTKLVVTNAGTANGTYLPTWNGHGDLLALWQVQADGTLTLAASVTYDTWGKPTVTTANGIPDLGWSRLYVGRSDVWWDNAFGAGLLYMHARTYSPTLGRFLQPDPIAAEGNLYAYAGNSPVTKADPSGTFWYKVGKGETVAKLANRFHISIASIYRFNDPYVTRARQGLVPGMCIWIWQPEKINGTRSPGFATGRCYGWTVAAKATGRNRSLVTRPSRAPNEKTSGMTCSVSAWGGTLLIAEGAGVIGAVGEAGLLAAGGALASTGVGLIIIGGVGVAGGIYWIRQGCGS